MRPDPVHGHEHFGYADGVSQPGVRGTTPDGTILTPSADRDDRPDQGAPGQDLLWPGEFVFGYPGQDAQTALPPGEEPDFAKQGDVVAPPVPFMDRGAFMVFRRLQQQVPEFDASVKALAASIGGGSDGMYLMMRPVLSIGGVALVDFEQPRHLYFVALGLLVGAAVAQSIRGAVRRARRRRLLAA